MYKLNVHRDEETNMYESKGEKARGHEKEAKHLLTSRVREHREIYSRAKAAITPAMATGMCSDPAPSSPRVLGTLVEEEVDDEVDDVLVDDVEDSDEEVVVLEAAVELAGAEVVFTRVVLDGVELVRDFVLVGVAVVDEVSVVEVVDSDRPSMSKRGE